MSGSATLLVELVTEELPPKALKALGEAFAQVVFNHLRRANLHDVDVRDMTWFASPRRLAVAIRNVRGAAPERAFTQKVLPVNVAYDSDGRPTAALQGKLAAMQIDASALKRVKDGKLEMLVHEGVAPGIPLKDGLEQAIQDAIEKLPIPKVMSYAHAGGYYNDVKFVRPAHRLVALHGDAIVDVDVLRLVAGRTTNGHRFLARDTIEIATADAYAPTLEAEGKVIPSFAMRREKIEAELDKEASGATIVTSDALLDEVTALVEWPVVYAGTFDAAFLSVPQECLILTMQQNQKYFALEDSNGRLTNRFLIVSNLETRDPTSIIHGNERVLRARLADAKFFFDQDRKRPLAARIEKLAGIVYHNKLGMLLDRVERLRFIARNIAPRIGANHLEADRAALLAKADLVTDMVGEFPELQGTMGRYYAQGDGESAAVADAIAQHYWPRFAGDALPEGPVAQSVALADKLESLAGLFGIGQVPSGDKDPFGLRRAAIGVLRILIEKKIALSIGMLIGLGFQAFNNVATTKPVPEALIDFLYDRLRAHLREQGYSVNQIEAVLTQRPERIDLVPDQLAAVKLFETLPESEALAAANKRIVNILRKSETDASMAVDRGRLAEGAERDLWLAFQQLSPVVDAHCEKGDYTEALKALATAKPVVDRFFDDVMVMADDPAIRANRLALLRGVAQTMNRVADLSKLA